MFGADCDGSVGRHHQPNLLTQYDVDYSPSKTDFSKTVFLTGDFNQISFKNGQQKEHGWALINPAERKKYKVVVECQNQNDKRRAFLEHFIK